MVKRACAAVAVLLVLYLGTYAAFYYRGATEAENMGNDFFFYAPVAEIEAARDLTSQHNVLSDVFWPINTAHYRWFGGRPACMCVLFNLS